MNKLHVLWETAHGGQTIQTVPTSTMRMGKGSVDYHESIAFNVGDGIADHIVRLHNATITSAVPEAELKEISEDFTAFVKNEEAVGSGFVKYGATEVEEKK